MPEILKRTDIMKGTWEEVPIKGLPRYLAIIQGFIGWFMLTIFSVSLISQLLN